MNQYVIGIDYGSLSARALLIRLCDGAEMAESEYIYPHAIMSDSDFSGLTLERDAALQHPQDYLDALSHTFHQVLALSGVSPAEVIGVGVDFTASTVLPVTEDGTPLCFLPEFRNEPQAYVKLWKHHSAYKEADTLTKLAIARQEPWLPQYGRAISAEWFLPKVWETLNKAPHVYEKAARFIEAGDWLIWQLTGTESRSSCFAGYKALWTREYGYPSAEYLAEADPRLKNLIGTKIPEDVIPTGTKAGIVSQKGAALSSLLPGTVVTAPIIDGHAGIPGAGVVQAGQAMLIIGTSSALFALDTKNRDVPGICGCAADGVIPGYYAYEAGQSGVGDLYGWFVDHCIPKHYMQEAKDRGINIFALLNEKAAALGIGESGVLALDWWNGNRSPLADYDLSGMLLGLTLKTRPEDIYRALIESTAFGAKQIMDNYLHHGLQINEVYAAGGITRKNPFLMQLYADVLGMPIHVCTSTQASAKGSALFAAIASGYYQNIQDASAVISDKCTLHYTPNLENTEKYKAFYQEYCTLCEYFAAVNPVMKRLRTFSA